MDGECTTKQTSSSGSATRRKLSLAFGKYTRKSDRGPASSPAVLTKVTEEGQLFASAARTHSQLTEDLPEELQLKVQTDEVHQRASYSSKNFPTPPPPTPTEASTLQAEAAPSILSEAARKVSFSSKKSSIKSFPLSGKLLEHEEEELDSCLEATGQPKESPLPAFGSIMCGVKLMALLAADAAPKPATTDGHPSDEDSSSSAAEDGFHSPLGSLMEVSPFKAGKGLVHSLTKEGVCANGVFKARQWEREALELHSQALQPEPGWYDEESDFESPNVTDVRLPAPGTQYSEPAIRLPSLPKSASSYRHYTKSRIKSAKPQGNLSDSDGAPEASGSESDLPIQNLALTLEKAKSSTLIEAEGALDHTEAAYHSKTGSPPHSPPRSSCSASGKLSNSLAGPLVLYDPHLRYGTNNLPATEGSTRANAKVASLLARLGYKTMELARMDAKLKVLKATNMRLEAQNAPLAIMNAELKHENAELKRSIKHDASAVKAHLASAEHAAGLVESDFALLTKRLAQAKTQHVSFAAKISELNARIASMEQQAQEASVGSMRQGVELRRAKSLLKLYEDAYRRSKK